MPKKEITIYDIAKALNVSAATVSRGLKNHPSIGKETRKKIKDMAQLMGYQTNALASGLRTRSTRTLGVIVPRLNSNFMSTVLAGMEKAAVEAGYHLMIMQSQESKEKERESAALLYNHRVDGLMVSTSAASSQTDHFIPFFRKNIPVIFFDRVPDQPKNFHCIGIDNFKAGETIGTHFLEQGCQNMLHITGNIDISAYRERMQGFKNVLLKKNLEMDEKSIIITNLGTEDGKTAAQTVLQRNALPDAVFVSNDTCAIALIHYLKQAGIDIPGKIKIAGFNNDPFAMFLSPGLTTINYPGEELGIKTVLKTIKLLQNPNLEPEYEYLNFKLVVRDSTK
jgi:LacI family transcriptional regulator